MGDKIIRNYQQGFTKVKSYLSNKDNEETGTSLLCRKNERDRTVLPRGKACGSWESQPKGWESLTLVNIRKCLKGEYKEDRVRIFSVVFSDRMKSSRHKLKHRRFSPNIKKKKTSTYFYCAGDGALAVA